MTTAAGAPAAVPAEGWGSRENARSYADFARSSGWYRRLAADLVRRIDCRALNRVIDLCAGTGVLTRELLPLVPPGCRILAIDASRAMLAQAVRETQDGRVDWCCSRAEACARFGPGTIDAVLCSAALWETSVPAVLIGVRTLLRPGGRFVFNLGPAAAPCWAMYEKAMLATDFTVDNVEPVSYELTVGQADQWLSLPAFAAAGPPDRVRAADGDRGGEPVRSTAKDPTAILRAPWVVVSATAGTTQILSTLETTFET